MIVDPNTRLLKVVEKPIFFTYDKDEINKNLLNKESIHLLYFYNLKLPGGYKDKSLKELQKALEKSQKESSKLKDKLKMLQNMIILKEKVLLIPKVKIQVKIHWKMLQNIIFWKFTITIQIYSENIKKKQAQVFYISATLFNFSTDLNYSVVRFFLEIMEYYKSFLKLPIFLIK